MGAFTPDDHGPMVVIAIWIAFSMMVVLGGLKIYTKWEARNTLAFDDWSMLFAMVNTLVTFHLRSLSGYTGSA